MSGRFGDIIAEARKEDKKTDKPSKDKTSKPVNQQAIEYVNLTIKVRKEHRQHWTAEAKREGTSMVSVIQAALEKRFGLPQNNQ